MKAIVLAGGKGQRLAPYTTVFPKPLMPIGDIPILEVVVRQLKHSGYDEITVAVGYLAELLMAYFGDGSKWGVRIRYSREEQPLGTAGPLRLVQGLNEPFLVMNGDLLTTLDYRAMWEAHRSRGATATVATFQREVRIELGVLDVDEEQWVRGFTEKPVFQYVVNTGVYLFDPAVLEYIPPQERLDMPDLILRLLRAGHRVSSYPIRGLWLDIGRPDDYERAVAEFEAHRAEFVPEE